VTESRRHTQKRYQIRSGHHTPDFFGRSRARERQAVFAVRRELFEGMILRRDIKEVARAQRLRSMIRILSHGEEPIRLCEGEWSKQHSIHNGEDCGICADSQG